MYSVNDLMNNSRLNLQDLTGLISSSKKSNYPSDERYNSLRESTTKMLEAIGQSLEMMYAVKGECEKPVLKGCDDKMVLPLVNHFTEESRPGTDLPQSSLPETLRQRTPDASTSPTIRQSKSDTELSIKDKTPSPTGTEESNLEQVSMKATSKSSIEFSLNAHDVLVSGTSSNQAVTNVTSSSDSNPITIPSRPPRSEKLGYSISPAVSDDVVPYTSYSSSDEEAEFFDADEFQEPEVLPPRINPQPSGNGLNEGQKKNGTFVMIKQTKR